jgi:hypothetical protein
MMCESMACFHNKMPMTFLFCSKDILFFMRKHCGCKSNVDTLWVKDLSIDMFAKYGSTKDPSITVLKDAHTGYSCVACHGYWTCEMWERTEVIGTIRLAKCSRKGDETESVTFLEALYAFTNLVTHSKEPNMFMSTLFKLVFECNLFVHNWLIIMYVKLWRSEGWLDMVCKMVIGVEDYQSTHLVFGVAPFGGSHTIVGSVTVTMP